MTIVEVQGYTLRYNKALHEWEGPGAPDDLVLTCNYWPAPENYYRSADPNPGKTRAEFLRKEFGAKIIRLEEVKSPFKPDLVY